MITVLTVVGLFVVVVVVVDLVISFEEKKFYLSFFSQN